MIGERFDAFPGCDSMDRNAVVAALAPAFLLYACDRAIMPADEPVSPATTIPSMEASGSAEPAAQASSAEGVNDGDPNLSPAPLTPEAAKGIKGARNVLLSFARAIELREFEQAWAMLSPGDRQKWSKAEFTKLFVDLDKITVAVPEGATEAAAGSSYYSTPITVTANDKDGRPIRIEGEAVLRRVNDVDGAAPAQLRWHFYRLTLDWTH